MRSSSRLRFALLTLASIAVVLGLACGGSSKSSDGLQKVTVQLDWTPNTNHIGIYLAMANGWYKDAGLDVQILPYGDQNPDTVVANGKADVGISFPANVIFSRAAGLDLVSVAAVLQTNPTQLAVLASSDIQRPKDLDGKTYAGFGLPYEAPQIKTVIQTDGGKGDFDVATLSTDAYEALYNKQADFTEIFTTWEGIEADLRGIKLRTFRYADYGMPDFPGVVLIAQGKAVKDKSPKLEKFLEVTRRGYEYAAQNPDDAAKQFMNAVPAGTFPEPELVTRSTEALKPYLVANNQPWGVQNTSEWNAYTQWFVDQGIVKDSNDKVIKNVSDLGTLYSDVLLPGG
ncbi:MAG TPA: ABC transporter substrate-binding protein [Dehalococcoidia bacterium]|nr:ABC transporter substrate-binding protein [Dehalococcoidia bacterium]